MYVPVGIFLCRYIWSVYFVLGIDKKIRLVQLSRSVYNLNDHYNVSG